MKKFNVFHIIFIALILFLGLAVFLRIKGWVRVVDPAAIPETGEGVADYECHDHIMPLTDEEFQAFMDLDFDDPDYDADLEKIIGPLKIEKWENLSDMIPPQEELDQWVGKTGQELFDAGWTNSGWNLEGMEFWMNYGPFMYTVVMEGTVENTEDFDEGDIAPLVVKSVTYNDLGDAGTIEE